MSNKLKHRNGLIAFLAASAGISCIAFAATRIAICGEPPRIDVYGDPLPPNAIARIGSTRLRHDVQADVHWAAFSPDNTSIISAAEGQIRFWDARSRRLLAEIKAAQHVEYPPISLSPDGRLIAIGLGTIVKLFDAASGKPQWEFDLAVPRRVGYVKFSKDGTRIVAASGGRAISVLSIHERHKIRSFDGAAMCYTPAADLVAVQDVTAASRLKIFNASSGKLVREIGWPSFTCSPTTFSDDGKLLAVRVSRAADLHDEHSPSSVYVIDAKSGDKVYSFESTTTNRAFDGNLEATIRDVFSPNGMFLAIQQHEGATIFDLAGKLAPVGLADRAICFSNDSKRLACSHGPHLKILDTTTWTSDESPFPASRGAIVFTRDAKQVITLADSGNDVLFWDAANGRLVARLPVKDASTLASASSQNRLCVAAVGRVILIDAEKRRAVSEIAVPAKSVQSTLAVSDDGAFFALADEKTIRVYSSASGRIRAELACNVDVDFPLVLSPNGALLASAEWNNSDASTDGLPTSFHTAIWDVGTGSKVLSTKQKSVGGAPFTFIHGGHLLLVNESKGGDNYEFSPQSSIYETATGQAAAIFSGFWPNVVMPDERTALCPGMADLGQGFGPIISSFNLKHDQINSASIQPKSAQRGQFVGARLRFWKDALC